jgi:predicted nucleic acid-binding protein
MPIQNLLFIDTNIWLDFYRARNEAGLRLLKHAEAISDRLIVTYQLESEFKKNRQTAILEGMQELKAPQQISRPGIFSDAKATRIIAKNLKEAEKHVKSLRRRLVRALENPGVQDPIYKACQRIFHKDDELTLSRDNTLRHMIRRKAFRRFLHGCPPRKKGDTSIGDAFNWEWMVHCATERTAGLIIVTRDSDYGATLEDKSYINDHLRQEFSERVSRKRKLLLYSRLAEALKLFEVDVSPQEEEAEKELVSAVAQRVVENSEASPNFRKLMEALRNSLPSHEITMATVSLTRERPTSSDNIAKAKDEDSKDSK